MRWLGLSLVVAVAVALVASCGGGSSTTSSDAPMLDYGAGYGAGGGADSCDAIASSGNPYPCCNNTQAQYGNGNCTWYAAYRANSAWDGRFYALGSLGNAKNWWVTIQSLQASTTDPTAFVHELSESLDSSGAPLPVVGSIAINTSGDFGHVAWVTEVSGSNVTVMEQNCIHDNDKLLSASFPASLSNSVRSKTRDKSFFQHYVVRGHAPTASLYSRTGSSVAVGKPYTLVIDVADADANLANVDINWNDGSANPVESVKVGGASARVTFERSFAAQRSLTWTVNAYDSMGLASTRLSGVFDVTATAARQCTGVGGGLFNAGQTEALSCPTGQTGTQTHVCQTDGSWGTVSGSCTAPQTQCVGSNGGLYAVGQTEVLNCPAGQTGTQSRVCQANGTWGAVSGSCTSSVMLCTGINGGQYSVGQTEFLGCPSGQTGSPSHTCQAGGVWSGITGSCVTPGPSLTDAAKTGNLARKFACPSGASTCVQAGITLSGAALAGFSSVTAYWSGPTGSGQHIFAAGDAQIASASDTAIVVWPTVFDGADAVGTCYTWSFKITKGAQSTSTLGLSTGQICRPSGV